MHQSTVFAQYAGCDESQLSHEEFKSCIRDKPAEELMDTLKSWLSPNWPGPSNTSWAEFIIKGYSSIFHEKIEIEVQEGGHSSSSTTTTAFASMAAREDFEGPAPFVMWTPVVDGTVHGIPETPLYTMIKGEHNKVPLLTSTTQVGR